MSFDRPKTPSSLHSLLCSIERNQKLVLVGSVCNRESSLTTRQFPKSGASLPISGQRLFEDIGMTL